MLCKYVVCLIIVCWVLLLLFFRVQQMGHSGWPIEIFASACVGQIHINSFYVHLLPQRSIDSCHIFASLKYSAFVLLIMVRWCSVLGAEQCWVVLWTTH